MLIWLVAIYAVWCGVLFIMQRKMMFPAEFAGAAPTQPTGPDTVVFEHAFAEDEKTIAWLEPAPGSASSPKPTVVFFHGNAELIHQQQWIVNTYNAMGWNVLLIEYRGYGNCGGTPSERAIVADSLALIDLAAGRPEIDATRLVYHGRSIGGAIAAQVAARRAPWALILESTFTHAGWFALRYGAPPFLVTSPFRTKSVLPLLTCPILLFHGTADSIIPVAHGRKLAKIQPAATLVEFDGATHNDMPGPGNEREYWTRIGAVLGGT